MRGIFRHRRCLQSHKQCHPGVPAQHRNRLTFATSLAYNLMLDAGMLLAEEIEYAKPLEGERGNARARSKKLYSIFNLNSVCSNTIPTTHFLENTYTLHSLFRLVSFQNSFKRSAAGVVQGY